jgi:valyl-tRNA synthetase
MGKGKFNFKETEEKWAKYWEEEKIYKFDSDSDKKIFSVDTPPPTISGRLHMGHFFGDSQQDFFVRYKRMKGFNVLNPFGTDNNGLPTLKLVEKEKKVSSKKMSREEFIELSHKTIKEEFVPEFIRDYRRAGMSADLDLFYSTIDERSRRISQKSFIDLYKDGREYRLEAPALWCPTCQTTIAQVELQDVEKETTFNDILFKLPSGEDLIIATTRPELLPACVSVFINPKDKRAKDLVGKKVKVPLFNFEVPILEDEKADPEKGSGVVMCCTFGDQTDMEWQKEHGLPIKLAINKDGTMSKLAGKYSGMKIEEARNEIIKDLKEAKLLTKQEKIVHEVNTCERCSTPIEFISTKQWFIKYLDLKKDMLKWGKEIKWYPEFMRSRYENWVKGLKWDWCISRQIPFGIPFPVWYCKDCDYVLLAEEEDLPVDPLEDKPSIKSCLKCGCKEFVPEKDIMNTWATSSLTPVIVKDLLKGTKAYEKIKDKPMDIRRNGHDIITFWDFTTIVKSQLHNKILPWNNLFINGWMLGKDGKKMSKSRDNGIPPQEVVEEWGADVLRYLCAYSKLGDDLSFPEKELQAGKKFINKLLNASRFVFMNLEGYDGKSRPKELEVIDEVFLKKLNGLILDATESFEKYEYSKAKAKVEQFFFQDFCDNYLEIVKRRVYQGEGDKKLSAQYTLYKVLLSIVKMFSPITPFICEEIYQSHFKEFEGEKSIHISSWPETGKEILEEDNLFDLVVDLLSKIRQEKTNNKSAMNAECNITLEKDVYSKISPVMEDLKNVTNAKEISEGKFNLEFLDTSD